MIPLERSIENVISHEVEVESDQMHKSRVKTLIPNETCF